MAAKRSVTERAPLDRALIASTAAEVIDEVGVENLTMRSMAARLGVTAMALYHHVEDKDELLRMVGDDLLGQIELPDPDSGDWRELFTAIVTAAMDALRSVPGLSSVLLTSKLLPNARKIILFCIHQFERAGLDRDAAWEAYAAVHQLVLGRLLVEESPNFQLSLTPHGDDEIRDYVAKLRSPASFDSALSALLDHYLPPGHRRRARKQLYM
jgi:TetR/AcrR family transcriptional regulator, tetracycline repressor protein